MGTGFNHSSEKLDFESLSKENSSLGQISIKGAGRHLTPNQKASHPLELSPQGLKSDPIHQLKDQELIQSWLSGKSSETKRAYFRVADKFLSHLHPGSLKDATLIRHSGLPFRLRRQSLPAKLFISFFDLLKARTRYPSHLAGLRNAIEFFC